MTLNEELNNLAKPGNQPDGITKPPTKQLAGWEAGIRYEANEITINTGPLAEKPKNWDELLKVWNLDPATHEVIEPVQYRAWDAPIKGGSQRMFYYKASVRERKQQGQNLDDLLERIDKFKRIDPVAATTEQAFVIAWSDSQIGKPDGDGTAGTINRILTKTTSVCERLQELKRKKIIPPVIYLIVGGDCIEGTQTQGGRLVGRLDATLTEQVRIFRRLLLKQIQMILPYSAKIVVIVVPGNHDEALRVGNQMASRSDDSWAIEGAAAVADALDLAGIDSVSFVFPQRDKLTVTVDVQGTIVGVSHGHQARSPDSMIKWWQGQSFGNEPIGDADLLITGHFHHLRIQHATKNKTWIQLPATDGGSEWYSSRSGMDSPAAILSLFVGGGGWNRLELH
jgi:predicted phosphodiesterase